MLERVGEEISSLAECPMNRPSFLIEDGNLILTTFVMDPALEIMRHRKYKYGGRCSACTYATPDKMCTICMKGFTSISTAKDVCSLLNLNMDPVALLREIDEMEKDMKNMRRSKIAMEMCCWDVTSPLCIDGNFYQCNLSLIDYRCTKELMKDMNEYIGRIPK